MGHAIAGPTLLQIWRIGNGLPGLALALCLQGGVVWDCKWQPGSQSPHSNRRASLVHRACMSLGMGNMPHFLLLPCLWCRSMQGVSCPDRTVCYPCIDNTTEDFS